MRAILDDLWRRAVKIRDRGICRYCEKELGLEAHHVFEKGSSKEITRFMLSNGCSLCPECHRYAHDNKDEFRDFWKFMIGDADFRDLEWLSSNADKMTLQNYEDLITLYRSSI